MSVPNHALTATPASFSSGTSFPCACSAWVSATTKSRNGW